MTDHKLPSPEDLLSHTKWLTAFARTLVLDESRADDLAQQALLEALERPPRDIHALPSWFTKVIRHLAYKSSRDEANRKRREKRVAKREEYRSTVSHMLERAELNRVIVEIVLDLPECLRDTVLLRFFEDLSPKKIAKIYEVPVTTVRSRIDRALELLRSRLDRRFGGDRMTWCFAIIPARAVCQVKEIAAGSTPSVTVAMGGAVMSTKVVFTAVAAGAIGLAFVLGGGTRSIDEDAPWLVRASAIGK